MTDDVFPVVYSTLTCDALVTKVLPCYGIDAIACCQFWNRGLSDVYLIETASQRYILRVSHVYWRSKPEIDFELELLEFLQRHQIPVAYPLRTQQDQLSVEINAPEGKRYAVLFTYAPGRIAVGDLNDTQGYNLGEVVAKLHQATLQFRSSATRQTLTLEYLLNDSLRSIAPFMQQQPQQLTYLMKVSDRIKQQLEDLPQVPPFWVVCWGDAHSGNAHFTEANQVTLFDFDQCGYGWRAFEIAKFLQVSVRAGISKHVRDAFLSGYQAIQPLTDFEINSLHALTQAAHIWSWFISLNYAKLHNYSKLDDSYFKLRLEQLKRLESPDWQLF
jgi:Ser/Thr protein kinase RdoA (MazF antagonist)